MPQTQENTLDNIKVNYWDIHREKKVTTFKEFIKLDPETLEPSNQELYKIMKELYVLNDREPPLYKSFPDWPNKPLTIDATTILSVSSSDEKKEVIASFHPKKNVISFKKSLSDVELLDSLAHELKHAEQNSQELLKMQEEDGLAYHQIGYLIESQAYAFGDYVATLSLLNKGWDFDKISKTYLRIGKVLKNAIKNGEIDRDTYEKDGMRFHLSRLLNEKDEHYKEYFHRSKSIKNKDKGISQFPESLNLPDKAFQKEFLNELRKIPREAEEPGARLLQMLSDNHRIKAYIYSLKKMIKYKMSDKPKESQSVLDDACVMLGLQMYNDTISLDEFKKTLKDLRRMGINMKNEEVHNTICSLASTSKELFDLLYKQNIINKNNLGDVLTRASLRNDIPMIGVIIGEIKKHPEIKKEKKIGIFQEALWSASQKGHFDAIKEILKGGEEVKVSMKDILISEEPLLLMSLVLNKRVEALDLVLGECQKEGSLKNVLDAQYGDGRTISSYLNRPALSDVCKKYSILSGNKNPSVKETPKTHSKNNNIKQSVVSVAAQQKKMSLEQ